MGSISHFAKLADASLPLDAIEREITLLAGHLTLLRHKSSGARELSGRRREWWQSGQRGSQEARTRAIAMRTVMKLSWKWRSGRDVDRLA